MASCLTMLLDLTILLIIMTKCLDGKWIAIPSEHKPIEDSSDVVSSANSKSTRRLMQYTTPAPTVPENITCTDENYFVSGEYNDEVLSFYIQVNYPSNITIDARKSTVDNGDYGLIGLELHFPDGTTITDGDNDPGVPGDKYPDDFLLMRVVTLEKGNYRLDYFIDYPPPQNKYGTFALSVRCDALPTSSPTAAPTSSPTDIPTTQPTPAPTLSPTDIPTTQRTPAPTDPENITCSDDNYFVTGDYNDELLTFYIEVTEYSNIIIDACNSTVDNGDTGIIGLEFHFPDGSVVVDNDVDDQHSIVFLLLEVDDLEEGIYHLDYYMGYPPPQDEYGTFDLSIRCEPAPAPTPTPTVPANMTCLTSQQTVTGEYNDELLTFYITLDFDSDITIDVRNSTGFSSADLIGIQLTSPDGYPVVDQDSGDEYHTELLLLRVDDLVAGTYALEYYVGNEQPAGEFGEFVLSFYCSTASPTKKPTPLPTMQPTPRPTKLPLTSSPTITPTTVSPTAVPTSLIPTKSPMTGAPSISPTDDPTWELTECEDQCTEEYVPYCCTYNGEENFDNRCLAECVYPTDDTWNCSRGSCETANPTADPTMDPTKDTTVDLTTDPSSDPSLAPTKSPSPMPVPSPTELPTQEPSDSPTEPLILEPRTDPTSLIPTNSPMRGAPSISPSNDPTWKLAECEDLCTEEYDPYCCNDEENFDNRCLAECVYPILSTWNCDYGRCNITDPTADPTVHPTNDQMVDLTSGPTSDAISVPTQSPTPSPTVPPTNPVIELTAAPTDDTTRGSTGIPTFNPTTDPTTETTKHPTKAPTADATKQLTGEPTHHPTRVPKTDPSSPAVTPTTVSPTTNPTSLIPTNSPMTGVPSISPTDDPTWELTECEDLCTEEYDPYCCNDEEDFDNRCLAECVYPILSTWNCDWGPCETADPTEDPTMPPTKDSTVDVTTKPTSDPAPTSPTNGDDHSAAPSVATTGAPTTTPPSEEQTPSPTASVTNAPSTFVSSSPTTSNDTPSPITEGTPGPSVATTLSPTNGDDKTPEPSLVPTDAPTIVTSGTQTPSPTDAPSFSVTYSPTTGDGTTQSPTTLDTTNPSIATTFSPSRSPTRENGLTSPPVIATTPSESQTPLPTQSILTEPPMTGAPSTTELTVCEDQCSEEYFPYCCDGKENFDNLCLAECVYPSEDLWKCYMGPCWTADPTEDTSMPPTKDPTVDLAAGPTSDSISATTKSPTPLPTPSPIESPTNEPTESPTDDMTRGSTGIPTYNPTLKPKQCPTKAPTADPTKQLTEEPTLRLTHVPTTHSITDFTNEPTNIPTRQPSVVSPTTAPPITTKIPTPQQTFDLKNDETTSTMQSTTITSLPTATPVRIRPLPTMRNSNCDDFPYSIDLKSVSPVSVTDCPSGHSKSKSSKHKSRRTKLRKGCFEVLGVSSGAKRPSKF